MTSLTCQETPPNATLAQSGGGVRGLLKRGSSISWYAIGILDTTTAIPYRTLSLTFDGVLFG